MLPDSEREPVIGGYRDPALVRVDSPEEPPPFKADAGLWLAFCYCTFAGLDAAHRGAWGYSVVAWIMCVVIVALEVSAWRNHNT